MRQKTLSNNTAVVVVALVLGLGSGLERVPYLPTTLCVIIHSRQRQPV